MSKDDVQKAGSAVLDAYDARAKAEKVKEAADAQASVAQQQADAAQTAYNEANNLLHTAGEALKKAVDELINPPAPAAPPATDEPRVDIA